MSHAPTYEQIPVASARAFVRHFVRFVLILLAGVAGANVIVNPVGLYPTRVFSTMVMNSRERKMVLLSSLPEKPDTIVLGSSRSMQVSPRLLKTLTGKSAFNFAVDSARAEDYYASFRWLVEVADVHPQLVIVGVDVEAFHNGILPDDRLLMLPELSRYLAHDETRRAAVANLPRLLSEQQTWQTALSLTRASWRMALVLLGKRRAGQGAEDPNSSHFEPDGYLRYDQLERERTAGTFDLSKHIDASIHEYTQRYGGYNALSRDREDYFEHFLAYARTQNTTVVLYLTPLHERVLKALRAMNYDVLKQAVVASVTRAALRNGASFVDFSTVDRFGGDPAGFWDGGHCDDRNCAIITTRLVRSGHAVQ